MTEDPEGKQTRFMVTISTEQNGQVEDIARFYDLSKSDVVRLALRDFIRAQSKSDVVLWLVAVA